MPNAEADCIVAGGGPAGMMAGYLLARAGISTIVLEKHKDFLRDFRGDTIHPSTLDVLAELGLLEAFLKQPHQKVRYAEAELGDEKIRIADMTHLPTRCKFLVFMPQWDFLNFLAGEATKLPHFRLMMESEATGLIRDGNRITGVTVARGSGTEAVLAKLVIGADGRHSRLRDEAGLPVKNLGAPMDVLWFRLPHQENEEQAVLGRVAAGQALVMLYRGDYWQCALIIRKGTFDAVKQMGLASFRQRVANLAKRDHADSIQSWDDVKLLTVAVDRLERWHLPGLLFIGDAAHAMSPIGGVGINLAIQDAVAAANLLAGCFGEDGPAPSELARVPRRRRFPTWATQAMQIIVQNRAIDPVLKNGLQPKVPAILRLAQQLPILQRVPARIIGVGFRPEHVRGRAR